jgi:hypothetical protein
MIESTTNIRRSLGKHLAHITKLDPWFRERKRTDAIKLKLKKKHDNACGYCRKRAKLVAAHIIPLEIGASTTEDNIILLCDPCHNYYDSGHLSINAMSKVAKEWRAGISPQKKRKPLSSIHSPKPSITLPPASLRTTFDAVLKMQGKRWCPKAIKVINKILNNDKLSATERVYLQIKRAELFRRRSAKGVVDQARQYLLEIDPQRISAKYLPVYYYELNYVHRLMGNHIEAARVAQRSAKASLARSGGRPQVDYVAASVNELLCNMAAIDKLSKKQAKGFKGRLARLNTISEKCGKYWGGRWALNCAAHGLQVCIKAQDPKASWKSLNKLRKLYFDSDVTNGWDSGGYQTISLLEGLVHVLFPKSAHDINTGIGLLARSFMTRLGPQQRPEGIRDAGFGLAVGLRKTKDKSLVGLSKHLENLMQKTVDGTSVLRPYKKI